MCGLGTSLAGELEISQMGVYNKTNNLSTPTHADTHMNILIT